MSRLTLTDIAPLRAQSEPLPCSVAPYTSSDSFKSEHTRTKPKSKTVEHLFSHESRNFAGSALKKSATASNGRKVIPLGTGRPTSDLYPWNAVTLHEMPFQSARISVPGNHPNQTSQTIVKQGEGYNLALALNYGHAAGSPQLVRFLTEHVELVHNPPYADWVTCLSCGSTSAIEIALRIFVNRGDTILTEQFTYPGAIEVAGLVGASIQGVEMDAFGIRPDCLWKILRMWDSSRGRKPRLLYTIPSGQNPTGVTQSEERRGAIYEIAEENDLIILEDDPYYFLHMGLYAKRSAIYADVEMSDSGSDAATEAYLNALLPSYLSLDRSGRVVRLDSTSKILAPGLRAGWVTASAQVIDKFLSYHEVGVVAVGGPTQIMLYSLLDQSWGHRGFFSWLQHLSQQYRSRRDALLRACNSYLPEDICRWVPPEDGMFIWISLDWQKHPQFQINSDRARRSAFTVNGDGAAHPRKRGNTPRQSEITRTGPEDEKAATIALIEARILADGLAKGVQVTKGSLFQCEKKLKEELHFRLTFAAAPEDELDDAVRKFANVVRKEFAVNSLRSSESAVFKHKSCGH